MSTEANKTAFRRIPEEVINTGNFALANELLAADYIEHVAIPPGMPTGVPGFTAFFTMLRAAFPDLHYTVEAVLAEGDLTAGHITAQGTHHGKFMGIPPTGKQVTWTETHIGRYEDGKLVEHWGNSDDLGLLQQLGAIPAAAPPGGSGAASARPRAAAGVVSPEEHKALVGRFFAAAEDFWRTGNPDLFDEVLPPDYVNHTPGIPPDRAGFKQAIPLFRVAFPDLHIAVEDLVVEGDKVAARVTNRGTHRGEFMGIPPTGRPIVVTEMYIYRVADGQLVERWGEWDALGLMRQLGAVSTPGQTEA